MRERHERLAKLSDQQLDALEADVRQQLSQAYAQRIAIIRERERRAGFPKPQVAIVSAADIAAEPGAPLTAGYWIDKANREHECNRYPFGHSLTECLRAEYLTEAQRKLWIRTVQEGELNLNGRATKPVEALEAAELVNVDWDSSLDLQKSRLRWHIKVTPKRVS